MLCLSFAHGSVKESLAVAEEKLETLNGIIEIHGDFYRVSAEYFKVLFCVRCLASFNLQ